ncbi:MAG: ChaN family lipoprotein [Bacteroidales bacterium]
MMKTIKFFVFPLIMIALMAMQSDKPAYRLFDKNGLETPYENLLRDALAADVVLFGELHNNPISHWLQLELTRDLYAARGKALVLGAEMFETDNQMLIDEYLHGDIRQRNFESEVKLWNNYQTDYKPLLEFAKDSGLRFIATNVPRRYASVVHQRGFEGLDSLSAEAKKLMPPLPVPYDPDHPPYKAMIEMMGEMSGDHSKNNLPKAQAIKDATMAWFILENLKPGELFLHFNGAYHSNNYGSICWYINNNNPDIKILTISSTEQDSMDELNEEELGSADYIILSPSTMTKTH